MAPDLNWYEDPAEFSKQFEAAGSSAAALSRESGIAETTIRRWRDKHGLSAPKSPARKAPKIGEPVSREELLEAELKELRSNVAKVREVEVAQQAVLELLEGTINAKVPRYKPAPRDKRGGETTHSMFLQWSDLHAAERVSGEEMNGINSYDWDTMLERHETLRQAILSFRDNRGYDVDTLHIGALGDMVTGDIHDELKVTNEKVLAEATVQLGLDMAEWIEGFVPEFPRIHITGVVGNHGRRTKKPPMKQAFDNFDWIFFQILKQSLAKYDSVRVDVPKSNMTPIEIFGKRILLWHGDGVRSSMVGVPWGGIIRRSKELDQQYAAIGLPIDHYAIGHWHEANQVANRKILVNGSIKGPDEYSLLRHGGGQPATQLLHTFHPRRGITDTSYIDLQGVR